MDDLEFLNALDDPDKYEGKPAADIAAAWKREQALMRSVVQLVIKAKNDQLASKDQVLASKDQALASKDQAIVSNDQAIASAASAYAELRYMLAWTRRLDVAGKKRPASPTCDEEAG